MWDQFPRETPGEEGQRTGFIDYVQLDDSDVCLLQSAWALTLSLQGQGSGLEMNLANSNLGKGPTRFSSWRHITHQPVVSHPRPRRHARLRGFPAVFASRRAGQR